MLNVLHTSRYVTVWPPLLKLMLLDKISQRNFHYNFMQCDIFTHLSLRKSPKSWVSASRHKLNLMSFINAGVIAGRLHCISLWLRELVFIIVMYKTGLLCNIQWHIWTNQVSSIQRKEKQTLQYEHSQPTADCSKANLQKWKFDSAV